MQKISVYAPILMLAATLAACGNTPAAAPAATTAPAATNAPAAVTAAPAATTASQAPAATAVGDSYGGDSYGSAPTTAPEATVAPASTAASTTGSATTGMRVFVIDPAGTTASYAVQEVFLRQNLPFRAVGTTSEVEGTFSVNAEGKPTGEVTNITVNLPSLTSDDDRRDGKIRSDWLQSDSFPLATFTSTGVEGIPESYTEGEEVTFKLLGTMTIRDITKPVTFDVVGKLTGDTVTGSAKANIKMTDFGFSPPDIAGFVTVEDDVEVAIQFTAKEQ